MIEPNQKKLYFKTIPGRVRVIKKHRIAEVASSVLQSRRTGRQRKPRQKRRGATHTGRQWKRSPCGRHADNARTLLLREQNQRFMSGGVQVGGLDISTYYVCTVDSDHEAYLNSRTDGRCQQEQFKRFGHRSIAWLSRAQQMVAPSSSEAECVAFRGRVHCVGGDCEGSSIYSSIDRSALFISRNVDDVSIHICF